MCRRKIWFYEQQAYPALPVNSTLPVILHVRKSSDRLAQKRLRQPTRWRAGSPMPSMAAAQQAQAFIDLGFKLGFGAR